MSGKAKNLPCAELISRTFYKFPFNAKSQSPLRNPEKDIGKFGLSSYDFAIKWLEEEDVALVPGTAFGECGEGSVRCCYATALDDIKEAMTRIERFIGRL